MEHTKTDVNPLARLRHSNEPIARDAVLRPVDPQQEIDALMRGMTAQGHYIADNLLGIDADAAEVIDAVRQALESDDASDEPGEK